MEKTEEKQNLHIQGGWADFVSLLIKNIDIKFYFFSFFFLLISLVCVSSGKARLELLKCSAN